MAAAQWRSFRLASCLAENGPCGQRCAVAAGRARCSCFPGFSLKTDGHACEGKTPPPSLARPRSPRAVVCCKGQKVQLSCRVQTAFNRRQPLQEEENERPVVLDNAPTDGAPWSVIQPRPITVWQRLFTLWPSMHRVLHGNVRVRMRDFTFI